MWDKAFNIHHNGPWKKYVKQNKTGNQKGKSPAKPSPCQCSHGRFTSAERTFSLACSFFLCPLLQHSASNMSPGGVPLMPTAGLRPCAPCISSINILGCFQLAKSLTKEVHGWRTGCSEVFFFRGVRETKEKTNQKSNHCNWSGSNLGLITTPEHTEQASDFQVTFPAKCRSCWLPLPFLHTELPFLC